MPATVAVHVGCYTNGYSADTYGRMGAARDAAYLAVRGLTPSVECIQQRNEHAREHWARWRPSRFEVTVPDDQADEANRILDERGRHDYNHFGDWSTYDADQAILDRCGVVYCAGVSEGKAYVGWLGVYERALSVGLAFHAFAAFETGGDCWRMYRELIDGLGMPGIGVGGYFNADRTGFNVGTPWTDAALEQYRRIFPK